MTFAVHSLAVRAIEIDQSGTMTLDGKTRIALPEPLKTFDTLDEAEQWRADRLGEVGR